MWVSTSAATNTSALTSNYDIFSWFDRVDQVILQGDCYLPCLTRSFHTAWVFLHPYDLAVLKDCVALVKLHPKQHVVRQNMHILYKRNLSQKVAIKQSYLGCYSSLSRIVGVQRGKSLIMQEISSCKKSSLIMLHCVPGVSWMRTEFMRTNARWQKSRQIYLKTASVLTVRAPARLARLVSCLHKGFQGKSAAQASHLEHQKLMHLPLPLGHSSLKVD